jgi:UDP-N-acetyl-alpha-D-muramoyl-L-alanyl-L-glutamate epimerase
MMATSELQNAANTPSLFTFRGVETDDRPGDVRFRYAYENGIEFCETIQFHAPLPLPDSSLRAGFDAVVEALNVALGVSYYKAFLPSRMAFARAAFAAPQLEFFQKLYVNGLGEFGYRNRVNVSERVDFRNARFDRQNAPQNGASAASRPAPAPVQLPRRSAVLLGGGKDSLVSVEILRAAKEPMVLLAVNPKKPIADCARASGFPLISVTRNLDPLLFKLNEKGALNGHVPITAIVSLIALAGAFVHGYDTVILSNERSADEGNIVDGGVQINHQYSKASEFEDDLRNYLAKYVGPGLAYFSLLRPLSELHIAQLMAKVDRYDECFTSCNRAFRLHQEQPAKRWCLDCPKCRFAFLILATALDRPRLLRVFGADLLDAPLQLPGYAELVGLTGHKPWECVGEIDESRAALLHLADDPVWRDTAIVSSLAPRLRREIPDARQAWDGLLTPSGQHFLPARYERMVHAYASAR